MICFFLLLWFAVAAVGVRSHLVASQIKINVFLLEIIIFDYYTIRAATVRDMISCESLKRAQRRAVQMANVPRMA